MAKVLQKKYILEWKFELDMQDHDNHANRAERYLV